MINVEVIGRSVRNGFTVRRNPIIIPLIFRKIVDHKIRYLGISQSQAKKRAKKISHFSRALLANQFLLYAFQLVNRIGMQKLAHGILCPRNFVSYNDKSREV